MLNFKKIILYTFHSLNVDASILVSKITISSLQLYQIITTDARNHVNLFFVLRLSHTHTHTHTHTVIFLHMLYTFDIVWYNRLFQFVN